jgi:hypothetical protein
MADNSRYAAIRQSFIHKLFTVGVDLSQTSRWSPAVFIVKTNLSEEYPPRQPMRIIFRESFMRGAPRLSFGKKIVFAAIGPARQQGAPGGRFCELVIS